jgi:prepilin-type N-terminal cleavage/methylation domain-containing protein
MEGVIKMLRKNKGFTLVEIMIVVAIIGLLAAIAIPNFVRARQTAQAQACIANLKQIEGAIQVWLLSDPAGSLATASLVNGTNLVPNYIKRTPRCPGGGVYAVTVDPPTCTLGGQATNPHVLP